MVIWKTALELQDIQEVTLPEGAKFISALNQKGLICIWAEVDPENPSKPYTINIRGTGQPCIEHPGTFIGTVFLHDFFVFHVYVKE